MVCSRVHFVRPRGHVIAQNTPQCAVGWHRRYEVCVLLGGQFLKGGQGKYINSSLLIHRLFGTFSAHTRAHGQAFAFSMWCRAKLLIGPHSGELILEQVSAFVHQRVQTSFPRLAHTVVQQGNQLLQIITPTADASHRRKASLLSYTRRAWSVS